MSQNQEDEEKKNKDSASQQKTAESTEKRSDDKSPAQPAAKPVSRPVIGTPIARPVIGKPISQGESTRATTPAPTTPQPASTSSQTQPPASKPVTRPVIGKPIGTTVQAQASSSAPAASAPSAPSGAPPVSRPTIGRPLVGTPTAGGAGAPKPTTGPPVPLKPTTPTKPVESKTEVSRRNFIRGIAIVGGLLAAAQFGLLGPYLEGTVESQGQPTQVIQDQKTNLPLKTTDIAKNDWKTFIWPRTGNPNVDNDTFSQCVIVHLPSNLTAPADLSAKDPISGDTFIAFSRVCVHLWCLWSYVPNDQRGECPCHGSQYVPGTGPPWNKPPGTAVLGPASLQTPPNNQLPIITLSIAADGTISATGMKGQVGCGQLC